MQSTDACCNALTLTNLASNIKSACVMHLAIASPALYLSAVADYAGGTNVTIKVIKYITGLTVFSHIGWFGVFKAVNFCLSQQNETESQESIRSKRFDHKK